MSVKRKSTLKAKVLTVILIVLFAGSCATLIFAICTGQLSREGKEVLVETTVSAEASTETATANASTSVTEAQTTASTTAAQTTATESVESNVTLGTTYNVDYWAEYKAENGSAGLGVLFGAHTQGVIISFDGDKFSVSVVNYDELLPVATGDYSFVSDSEIELRFDNSAIEIATVVESENGVATVIDFPMDIEDTTLRASVAQ